MKMLFIIVLFCFQNVYAEEKMITVGVNLQEISIDPFTDGNFQQTTISDLIFEPLVYIDENLNTVGTLVDGWEINTDADKYKFKLKKGIKFHDGRPFSAEDVVWTFKKHMSADSKSFHKSTLQEILFEKNGNFDESVKALDSHTVEFRLKGPYPPFLENLSNLYILPKGFNSTKPVGCGPFKVTKLNKGDTTLERVPEAGFAKTNIKAVKFVITQTDEFEQKLKSKELDLTLQAPLKLAINPPSGYSVFTSNFDLVSVVFYFNYRRETYHDPKVRHFIREKLIEARAKDGFLSKFDKAIDHLIPLGMMPAEYYSVKEIKKTKKPSKVPSKIKILAPNTFFTDTAIAAIKEVFKLEGVDVEFFLGKGKQLHEPAIKGDFDLALVPYEGMVRDPDAFMFLITPTVPIVSFFHLPTENEVKELNKVKFKVDKESRLKDYARILNKIEDDDLIIPLFGQNMPFLFSNKLTPPTSHVMTLVSLRFFKLKND